MSEHILIEETFMGHEHIALIKLNRPKVLNAISTPLLKEVVEALEALDTKVQTRAVLITGDDRAFAAGADLAAMIDNSAIDQYLDERAKLWKRFQLFSKPLIAAVNGFALGGGCELAMSCDYIIAGDNAKFGQPEIKVGITPGAGGTQRLTHLLGKSKAMRMVLTGEMITATQAENWGLVAKVVPAYTLLQEAFEDAKLIAEKSPLAARLAKEALNKSFEMSLNDGLDFERRNFYLNFAGKDQEEGMRAFLEKRPPNYQGS